GGVQAWVKRSIDSCDYICCREIRAVRELQVRTKIEGDAPPVLIDLPTGCELGFVLLRLAIHTDQHTTGEIAHDVRRVVFSQERVQGLRIGPDSDVKLATACHL